jgi:hypothetical protein
LENHHPQKLPKGELYASMIKEPELQKANNVSGCDTLFLNDKQIIICKVQEIGEKEIAFTSCVDSSRPLIRLSRKSVYFVAFSNGTYEEISPGTKPEPKPDGCATVYLNNGGVIRARIVSIKDNKVKYTDCDQPLKNHYQNDYSEVALIEHEDGRTEAFTIAGNKLRKVEEIDYEKKQFAPFSIVTGITSVLFVIFMIAGVLGDTVFGIIALILALVLAIMAAASFHQIKANKRKYKGVWLTIWSIVLPLIFWLVLVNLILARVI